MFKVVNNKHVPYDSTAEVLFLIAPTRRHIGQVFRITNGAGIDDYHFVGGIADENLVKKEIASSGVIQFTLVQDGLTILPAGTIISAIIVDCAVDTVLNIGTTAGGNDLAANLPITGGNPEPVSMLIYAKAARTVYFSGIVASTQFILIKNSL